MSKGKKTRQLFYFHSLLPSKKGCFLRIIHEAQHPAPAEFVSDTWYQTANQATFMIFFLCFLEGNLNFCEITIEATDPVQIQQNALKQKNTRRAPSNIK